MKPAGGNFTWCSKCGRRRCQPPHVQCAGCRPKRKSKNYPRSPEAEARRVVRQRIARQAAGVSLAFESW